MNDNKKYIIYQITNLINKKVYIGQTTKSLNYRWKKHCQFSNRQNKNITVLHKAIRKHGKHNFSIEQIDSASSIKELNNKEIYWIKEKNSLIPNGYNIELGGKHGPMSDFTKNKLRKIFEGKERHDNGIPIVCLNNNKKYPTIASAARELNIHGQSIRNYLQGKSDQIGKLKNNKGYKFIYFDNDYKNILAAKKRTQRKLKRNKSIQNRRKKRVYCLNNDKFYDSAKQASLDLKLNENSIQKVAKFSKKHQSIKGCVFLYEEKLKHKKIYKIIKIKNKKTYVINLSQSSKKVPIVCLNNKKIYESTKQASLDLKIKESGIQKVLSGKTNKVKNYVFRYIVPEYNKALLQTIKQRKCQTMKSNNSKIAQKIYCFNNKTTYSSAKIAAKKLYLNVDGVYKAANGYSNTTKGYRFRYVDDQKCKH